MQPDPFVIAPFLLTTIWNKKSLTYFRWWLRKVILFLNCESSLVLDPPLFCYHFLVACTRSILRSCIRRVRRVGCFGSWTRCFPPVIVAQWHHMVWTKSRGTMGRIWSIFHRSDKQGFHCYSSQWVWGFWEAVWEIKTYQAPRSRLLQGWLRSVTTY